MYRYMIPIWIIIFILTRFDVAEDHELLMILEIDQNWQGKYGYINYEGEIIIDTIYDWAQEFSEGRAFVRTGSIPDSNWKCLDSKGEVVFELQEGIPNSFHEGFAVINSDSGYHYVKKNGDKMTNQYFFWADDFNSGRARVKFALDGKTGYINCGGELVIDTIFRSALAFCNGYTSVFIDGDTRLIDTNGTVILPNDYDDYGDFFEGLIPVLKDDKWGYVNLDNQVIIEFMFDQAYSFYEGIALVRQGQLFGYIIPDGEYILAPQFCQASIFSEGLAAVNNSPDNSFCGFRSYHTSFINTKGESVIKGPFYNPSPFKNGVAQVWTGLDFTGEIKYIKADGERLY
jgi:hypothetical protein